MHVRVIMWNFYEQSFQYGPFTVIYLKIRNSTERNEFIPFKKCYQIAFSVFPNTSTGNVEENTHVSKKFPSISTVNLPIFQTGNSKEDKSKRQVNYSIVVVRIAAINVSVCVYMYTRIEHQPKLDDLKA